MSCEECERLRDVQDRTHRSYLEQIGDDAQKSQSTNSAKGPEHELKDAYDAAATEYKGHLATAHALRSQF
jgi:hypothetical protein